MINYQFIGQRRQLSGLLRLVGFRTHVHTATALAVEVVEAVVALLAASAVLQIALATLGQHALADNRSAYLFVARVGAVCEEAHQDHGNGEYHGSSTTTGDLQMIGHIIVNQLRCVRFGGFLSEISWK